MRARLTHWCPMLLAAGALALAGCPRGPRDGGDACEPNPEPHATKTTMLALRSMTVRQGTSLGGNGARAVNGTFLGGNGAFLGGNGDGVAVGGVDLPTIAVNAEAGKPPRIDGAENELVGTTADGKVLGGASLVGAKLFGMTRNGEKLEAVISTYEREDKLAYYRLTQDGQNVCANEGRGMFVPGVWDDHARQSGSFVSNGRTVTTSFSCMDGAIAKCVVWGWAPWLVGADVHQACTRLTRADYCGTGTSFTKDGVLIWTWDGKGKDDHPANGSMLFEAGWGPDGATCAARPRFDATEDGTPVLPSCWAGLPRCASPDEAFQRGAKLANMSPRAERRFCRP